MITARLYSQETLLPRHRETIGYGLNLIGKYVGGISILNSHLVKLPTCREGRLRIEEVKYKRLDVNTELHVIATPLHQPDRDREILGLAYPGSGVAFISPTVLGSIDGMTTVAHEASHALGFVTPSSTQSIVGDPTHCRDISCIMSPILNTEAYPDFCPPCANDIDRNVDYNVAKMGLLRNLMGKVNFSDFVQ